MKGDINISSGKVTASSEGGGAGVGSGLYSDLSGSINISGGNVEASSGNGAGIGAGNNTANNSEAGVTKDGSIIISGNSDVTAESESGTGIGTGNNGNMNGTVTITDNSSVNIILGSDLCVTGIGGNMDSSESGAFNGNINIHEHADISMEYENDSSKVPVIGSGNDISGGSISISTGATVNDVKGTDIESLKNMGIVGENAEVSTVEPTIKPEPEPEHRKSGHSYSLKELTVSREINEAGDGETVKIYEDDLDSGILPSYILENLATKDDITLVIVCDDFDIRIPSEDSIADAGGKRCYTIEELAEIYE